MKLLFAHDHIFQNYNNVLYSTGGLSKEMIERYTAICDELIIISRQKKITDLDINLTLASADNTIFVEIPNFKNIKNIGTLIKAREIIRKQVLSVDAIIARLPSSIGSIAIEMAKKYNKPYLIEVVACPWDALWNHSIKGKLLAPFSYINMKKMVRGSEFTIYVTEHFLQKRYPTNGISTNCSNVNLIDFDEDIFIRKKFKILNRDKNKPIIIGTIGAIDVKYKGQQFIIEALGKLKQSGFNNYCYQLVGAGNKQYLKTIAEKYNVVNQVHFLGTMNHKDIFNWLDKIDLYTQPSRQEGLPRALIEAMSRALPSFGARTAGIPELIDNDKIFSNTNKNIEEICEIILNYNEKNMIEQAEKNHMESYKYKKEIIEKRRNEFLLIFLSEI